MPPRKLASVPLASSHAPELLYVCGMLRFATAAQIYSATSYGAAGQQSAGMDALLSRLVKAGLMGSVSVKAGRTQGRPLKAFHLTASGHKAVGLPPWKAALVVRDAREKDRIVEGLDKAEAVLSIAHEGWRIARRDHRFSVMRDWALNRARDRALDSTGTEQVLVNGLRRMPDDSEFGCECNVLFRYDGTGTGTVRDAMILISAVSAAEARARVAALPGLLGVTVPIRFLTVGSHDVREQLARSIARTLEKRRQEHIISSFDHDFRVRTRWLGRATTTEDRQYWAVQQGGYFPWPRAENLAALREFGFTDLSIVSMPLVRPSIVMPEPPPPPPPVVVPAPTKSGPVDLSRLELFDGKIGRPIVSLAPTPAPAIFAPRRKPEPLPPVDPSGRGM